MRLPSRRVILFALGLCLLVALLPLPSSSPASSSSTTRSASPADEPTERAAAPVEQLNMVPQPFLHAFYYAWYGTPEQDGRWLHWNHVRMPHWNRALAPRYSNAAHVPPEDIGAKYYPDLGPYSSADTEVMHAHMRMLKRAAIGVMVVSWYHPSRADPNVRNSGGKKTHDPYLACRDSRPTH